MSASCHEREWAPRWTHAYIYMYIDTLRHDSFNVHINNRHDSFALVTRRVHMRVRLNTHTCMILIHVSMILIHVSTLDWIHTRVSFEYTYPQYMKYTHMNKWNTQTHSTFINTQIHPQKIKYTYPQYIQYTYMYIHSKLDTNTYAPTLLNTHTYAHTDIYRLGIYT